MPLVVSLILQRVPLVLRQLANGLEVLLVPSDKGGTGKEIGMFGEIVRACKLFSVGDDFVAAVALLCQSRHLSRLCHGPKDGAVWYNCASQTLHRSMPSVLSSHGFNRNTYLKGVLNNVQSRRRPPRDAPLQLIFMISQVIRIGIALAMHNVGLGRRRLFTVHPCL